VITAKFLLQPILLSTLGINHLTLSLKHYRHYIPEGRDVSIFP